MKIKIYLLRLAIAVAAFIFGISVFNAVQYFQSVFSAKEQAIESVAPDKIEPVIIEEITYPPQNVEQTKIPVVEQTDNSDKTEPETEIWEFDGNGSFYITDDLPKGFKDFDTISVTTRDFGVESEDYPYGVPIPPEGYVRTSKKYKFTLIGIANRQIAFKTETKEGISYKFVGKLIKADYSIEGRLTKMRNGKKIAESNVQLTFDERCTC